MTAARTCLAAIVAVADNGVIGRDGGMAWHIPSEFAYFRSITLGHPVIMGRKSFESIGRPLKDRINIVVTRDRNWSAPGVTVFHDLQDAIDEGARLAARDLHDCAFIIGGADIYAQAMPQVDRLYYTEVHLSPDGDAHFPAFDRSAFTEVLRRAGDNMPDEPAYTVTVLERKRTGETP